MTLSYVDQVASAVVAANSTAKIEIAIPVGQYWNIPVCHIGSQSDGAQSNASGGIYVGAVGSFNNVNLMDATFKPFNDTTGILSGTVVEAGNSIQAQFVGMIPGDTVFLHVWGVSSDSPPTDGISPSVPGFRFAGTQLIVTQQNLNPQLAPNNQPIPFDTGTLASNATFTIFSATALEQVYLFDIFVQCIGSAGQFNLSDTNNNGLGTFQQSAAGAPTNAFVPFLPMLHYSGAPLSLAAGVQITNTQSSGQRYTGFITISVTEPSL